MSKIALEGNASGTGTFTIASPNSNSNYTLTLPTETGTVLTNSGNQTGVFSALSVNSNNISADNSLGFRNRIINGDMRIDQRNAGAAVTLDGNELYPVDRFPCGDVTDGAFTAQQDTSAPAGFVNSLKCTITTADASLGATQVAYCGQRIEGTNLSDLGWGTASAKTVTLSFWVRSSLTGTFGGALRNSANDRSYPFTYTISVADTWEQKSITIAGDTTGTWLTTTGIGVEVYFSLGAGSSRTGTAGSWAGANYLGATGQTQVIGTLNATWYITGVQLEVGPSATSFDYRPYGTELALCQRYYFTRGGDTASEVLGPGLAYSTTGVFGVSVPFPVVMRTTPTFSVSSASNFAFTNSTGSGQTATAVNTDATEVSSKAGIIRGTVASGLTAGNCSILYAISSSARANWSAEL